MKSRLQRGSYALVAAVSLSLCGGIAAHATNSPVPPPEPDVQGPVDQRSVLDPSDLAQHLHTPAIPEVVAAKADEIRKRYGSDDRLGTLAISDDRSHLSVAWYGDVPADLTPSENLAVTAAPYLPGDLRRAAASLPGTEVGGAKVAGAGVNADASGVYVDLDQSTSTGARRSASPDRDEVANELSEIAGVPVRVNENVQNNPARLSDNLHLGGARISRFQDGYLRGNCSTAFATRHKVTGDYGMVTAAHCGPINSQWVRTAMSEGGLMAYHYGNMTHRLTSLDGAVLTQDWSNPYMYIGEYTSTQYVGVEAVSTGYLLGQEVCSSGSYSGMTCGGQVVETDYFVEYEDTDITSAKVARIVNQLGEPLWGSGDSGGPVFDLVSVDAGFRPRALGVISGIYWFEDEEWVLDNCNGVPAAQPNGRGCSPYGFAASVYEVANSLNWRVATLSSP
ncbi:MULTISPECIES: hypothetical protein [Cellulosimicrobium]|uniref:hypothetical protein n=1 Tax=Cellulosimicrobium TaxID=157920 RepID=UPI001BAA519E|nr:hypothetical protein [Cellulosimicrobium cellulans]QUC01876.1 hypothetical protein J5A69_19730 [Cellulosimicrobium cellulans]